MDIAKAAIEKKVVTLTLTFVMLGAGVVSYNNLGRLEDPEFTIKDALVITPYAGASAAEVEEEVSDELEQAVQKMGQLDQVISRSERGLSTLTVTMKDRYDKATLPQVWDELRRKVADAQGSLPPGAGPSIVVDDFGDVYGVFVAVASDEYTYAELKNFVDLLKKELLLVQDVAKIETFGERPEVIYVELQRDRMAQLGIAPQQVVDELRSKNLMTDSGRVRVGGEFIAIEPTGTIASVEDFGSILVSGAAGGDAQIYLRDVANIRRGYAEPPSSLIRYDGKQAIGMGISTVAGGNVVVMGEALYERAQELQSQFPLGIEFGIVSLQSESVTKAIDNFVLSLIEAVAIVIVVLLFFMGVRSALLIGFVLVLTIFGTFIFLGPMQVALERISLGALIIALGMLVDNAIVVVDGMLIKMQGGVDRKRAASEVVKQSAIPLLGATFIAILGFAAIGTSQDSTGEFCRSLYQVILTSLLLSWVTAVTVTPLLCVMFLKEPKSDGGDPYGGGFYARYKAFLRGCIRRRWATMAVVGILFAVSVWGFGFVENSFFPPSTRPQFMVDLWMPQGTHIEETTRAVEEIEDYLGDLDGVTHVSSVIGKGALRFLLTYAPEKANSSYAQFFVDVDDYKKIDGLATVIERNLAERFPEAVTYTNKFVLGPGEPGKIQARFLGKDPDVLRSLASQTMEIMHANPNAKGIRTDWRQRVKLLEPTIIEETANLNGISRRDVASVLAQGFQGERVGVYREKDLLLPIVMRAPPEQRVDVASVQNLQIWSPAAGKMIPLRQVVSGFETKFEDEIVQRRDRKRTIITYCDPISGTASVLFNRLRPQIEAIELPEGYTLEWGGEYENSGDAQAALAGSIPAFVLLMVLITIGLFNSLRTPLVIWGCVPLAIIGVTAGLLGTGNPFGFMSLLGFLSLMGMLIKNAIVLIDQITLEIREGKPMFEAIVDSGASRLRPVGMAASTTALGMIPLLIDPFFSAMAITIIGGLLFASVLTMVVVPVLYAILYRVKAETSTASPEREPAHA